MPACDTDSTMALLRNGFGLGGRIDRALNRDASPSFPFGTDEYWMEQALLCSMEACGLSPPNPSVGCILIKNEIVLSKGFTQAAGLEHAEKMAFKNISPEEDLSDASAYVTLEPCSHFGSQPPCVDLFLKAPKFKRIRRVVIACQDPDLRVNGQGIEKLRSAGIEVTLGVLDEEVRAFLFPFIANRKLHRPIWIAKWANTPKGYLADKFGNSKWISNKKSRAYTHWLRQKYDGIVVGAETYIRDLPKLTVRDSAPPFYRNPIPIVFDPKAKLLSHELPENFQHWVGESCLRKSKIASNQFSFPEGNTEEALFVNFKTALSHHSFSKPLQSILVEGGASLLNGLIEYDCIDAIHQFTGTSEFTSVDERYRIRWKPSTDWNYTTHHYFDEDHLQEWRKSFK